MDRLTSVADLKVGDWFRVVGCDCHDGLGPFRVMHISDRFITTLYANESFVECEKFPAKDDWVRANFTPAEPADWYEGDKIVAELHQTIEALQAREAAIMSAWRRESELNIEMNIARAKARMAEAWARKDAEEASRRRRGWRSLLAG